MFHQLHTAPLPQSENQSNASTARSQTNNEKFDNSPPEPQPSFSLNQTKVQNAGRRKPAKRGRKSNADIMREQAVCNFLERSVDRPCVNEDDVCESALGAYLYFKNKKDRKENLLKAYKVLFDIELPNIVTVGGELMPNMYQKYNYKYSIDELRDKMKLSKEGHILIGFRRIREDDGNDRVKDYLFDSKDEQSKKAWLDSRSRV